VQVNVSGLLKSPLGTKRNYQVSDVINISGGDNLVQGEVELTRTDRGILVRARLSTEVEVTCSRCLVSFRYPLNLSFEEEYFPVIDIVSGSSLPSPEEPGSFTIDPNHTLDLTEAVCQYVLLALPMKPLCRVDCAGLCPACGHNLNQGPYACPSQKLDLRWERLKKLAFD
jgi:uncharacterized protein